MKRRILSIPFLIVLGVTLLIVAQQNNTMIVFATGTPDEYGNRIVTLQLQQYIDEEYVWHSKAYTWDGSDTWDGQSIIIGGEPTEYTYTYPPGFEFKVNDNKAIKFWVKVAINQTLTTEALADDVTRIYINITASGYSLINQLMTYSSPVVVGTDYYHVTYYYTWNVASHPVAGVTYTVSFRFQAYY